MFIKNRYNFKFENDNQFKDLDNVDLYYKLKGHLENNTSDISSDIFKEPQHKSQNKHYYFLNKASQVASNSLLGHKHGCIIVYKGKIISQGYNHRAFKNQANSIHAEADALNKLNKKYKTRKILRDCTMYVVRITNKLEETNNIFKMSKPCEKCTKKIIDYGIRKTYYSTDNQYFCNLVTDQICRIKQNLKL